jgi:hypothetical protein
MKFVYIDESGYTGSDLLNREQPFQAASAIYISDDDASHLIKEHFPRLGAKELKYRTLSRRQNNWQRLYNLQKSMLEEFTCVTYICDKKYVLIMQFLDYIIEPFYYERGMDWYKDGMNYSLGSLLYYTGDSLLGDGNFSEVLKLFQYALKSKSDVSILALIEKVKASKWQEFPESFGPLVMETPSCIEALKSKETSSDAAFVVLLALVSKLESVIGTEYSVKHDTSRNLEQYDSILNKIINHKNDVSFRETAITKLKFPLNIKSVTQVDSKESFGVQLSDILVGGIIDSSKSIMGTKPNEYNKKIAELYKDEQLIHLLPSMDFARDKEFRRNTEGGKLIDYFAEHFR